MTCRDLRADTAKMSRVSQGRTHLVIVRKPKRARNQESPSVVTRTGTKSQAVARVGQHTDVGPQLRYAQHEAPARRAAFTRFGRGPRLVLVPFLGRARRLGRVLISPCRGIIRLVSSIAGFARLGFAARRTSIGNCARRDSDEVARGQRCAGAMLYAEQDGEDHRRRATQVSTRSGLD